MGYQASLSERMQEVSALCSSLGRIIYTQPPTNLPNQLDLGLANRGQGLNGHSIPIAMLITSPEHLWTWTQPFSSTAQSCWVHLICPLAGDSPSELETSLN